MSTLVLDHQGARLTRQGERLVFVADDVVREVPLASVDRLVVVGKAMLSSSALRLLAQHSIPMVLVTTRGGFSARLETGGLGGARLRVAQHRSYHDPRRRVDLAASFVRARISNSMTLLRRHRRNHGLTALDEPIHGMQAVLESLQTGWLELDSLMGKEGMATKHFFAGLALAVSPEFAFKGRSRRPPRDPFNALLSMGYTLLVQEVASALEAQGFDIYVGFLHEMVPGRPALSLDLVEEFRYLAEALALRLVNNRQFKLADFEEGKDGGVRMSDQARLVFYREYEKDLRRERDVEGVALPGRRLTMLQAEKMARAVREGEDYKGHRIR